MQNEPKKEKKRRENFDIIGVLCRGFRAAELEFCTAQARIDLKELF